MTHPLNSLGISKKKTPQPNPSDDGDSAETVEWTDPSENTDSLEFTNKENFERDIGFDEIKTIIETLNEAIYILDEKGRFTFVNDEFVNLVGYNRETILGRTPSLIKSEAAVKVAEHQLGRILSDDGPDTVTFEIQIQHSNGETVLCEDTMGVLPYEGAEFDGSVGVLRNITEQRQREHRFRTLIEQTNDIISVVDADGRFQYLNPSFNTS